MHFTQKDHRTTKGTACKHFPLIHLHALSSGEMCPNTKKSAEAHFKMYLDTSWLTGYIFTCAWVNHEIFRNQRHILKYVTIPMMLTNPLKSNFSRFDDHHEFKIKVVKNDARWSNARVSIPLPLKP